VKYLVFLGSEIEYTLNADLIRLHTNITPHFPSNMFNKTQVPPPTVAALQRPNIMSAIKSLLNSARESLSGTTTPTPGTPPNATSIEQLFTKVDPAIDGDDCDHDCESCEVKLPKGFKIEENDKLYGHIKGWSTHVLVATGKTDWVRDVEDEKNSVMEAFGKSGVKPSNGVSTSHICLI
jgi:hypothetical protein